MRLFLFLLLAPVMTLVAAKPVRPNVLLICVDDLKPALGCYSDALAKTPNLDRLAARGMRFDLAYCNQSVCAPSRNNLLLGSRSTSLGIYNLSDNFRMAVPDAVTLPQHFKNYGWRTEAIGKILHTGHGNHDDEASWSVPPVKDKVVEYLDPANSANGQLTREEAFFTNQQLGRIRELPRGAAWESSDVADNAYADGRIADAGVLRLRAAKKNPGEPLFLALGFVKPHLPFTAPKKYWDMHDRAAFPLAARATPPEDAPAYAGKTLGELNNYDPVPQEPPLTDDMQRTLMHGYYASVSFMDAQVGRVLDELDALGLSDKTIIVLWGDHGWHLGDHGMWTKHTNYEQANRIPLIIVAPGITVAGSRTKQPAETVDILPTLVELAGLPILNGPQPMDGISLVPVLRDPLTRVRDHATHAFPRQRDGQFVLGRAIRTERYRLVEWKKPGAAADTADLELYDYQEDPLETRNLAQMRPEVVAGLLAILSRHPEAVPPFAPNKKKNTKN
ncbi:iduronate 2-sulfatase [Prosthecobacter fusiformis]|uniref:Iduronate 2-sulfatase n=1 Tax=Prosthecobacter fusiformis TaxID=48464 RepID=A0A4R7RWW9_9BACT|nr:sulfatase [Prosthecobacter fusiformis]TDU69365.1 iduronate 2-sulfatase [Prosthecobacter fusiformis]